LSKIDRDGLGLYPIDYAPPALRELMSVPVGLVVYSIMATLMADSYHGFGKYSHKLLDLIVLIKRDA